MLAKVSVVELERCHKVVPGQGLRIFLAHIGKNVVDVALENRVGGNQVHVAGAEVLALLVEEIGDALQKDAGLSRAGDSVYQQYVHVVMAHHGILLTLDGGGDVAELVVSSAGQRCQKQGILDGHGGVEVSVELAAFDVELTAAQKLGLDGSSVCGVGCLAVCLVVIGFGDGGAPVDDEMAAHLVGDARGADVDVACGRTRAQLQAHLGEVGLPHKKVGGIEPLGVHVVGKVVFVDDLVHGLELDVGLKVHTVAEVDEQLVEHVRLVASSGAKTFVKGVGSVVCYLAKFVVGLVQVRLLLLENRVGSVVRFGFRFFVMRYASHWLESFLAIEFR